MHRFLLLVLFVVLILSPLGAQQSKPGSTGPSTPAPRGATPKPQDKDRQAAPQSKTATEAAQGPSGKPQSVKDVAWRMLQGAADSDKSRTRSSAVMALTVLDANRRAISLVVSALNDKDEPIRTLAATSLGDMNAQPAIPALRRAMDDPSPVVSFAAAQALWKMGDRSGRDLIYDVLTGERKTKPGMVQRHINEIKKDVHDPKALALIGINEASGAFLGPFAMGVSMLEEYAKETSAPAEALCVSLLEADNTPDTIEQLAQALWDNDWIVRAAAARALAKMNRLEIIPQLTEMMNTDKSEPARLVAAAALLKLKDHHSTTTPSEAAAAPVVAEQSRKP